MRMGGIGTTVLKIVGQRIDDQSGIILHFNHIQLKFFLCLAGILQVSIHVVVFLEF